MKKTDVIPILKRMILYIIPLLQILPGVILGLHYSSFSFLNVLIFTIFVYINYYLYSSEAFDKTTQNESLNIILTILNIVLIVILSINSSFFLGINLVLYILLLYSRKAFDYYNLNLFYVILVLFFNLVIFNLISFYIIAGFIPNNLFIYLVPLIIPSLMFQEYSYFKNQSKLASMLVFVTVGLSLVCMIFVVKFWALLLVFTIPLAYYLGQYVNIHFVDSFIFFMFVFQLLFIAI